MSEPTDLTTILADPTRNGVYPVSGALPELPGLLRLDARTVAHKEGLLRALGELLRFPDYYGENWDALEECLHDLAWWDGPVHVLIEHAQVIEPRTLGTLQEIWREAAAAWSDQGRSFVLLLHDPQTRP
ncbi:MAG: barstar family protein [Thiobacillaceae bacterium]|nr:barstar family protein [Thiobacillaceae bacterium]